MAMDFRNVVKGQIAQSLIKTLFERAGYRVTRLGVEELFDEVTQLDEQQYKALNLPLALRYLPDFLIADSILTTAFLLEVKFRKEFNENTARSLHYELTRQREFWPDSYAVILIATSSFPFKGLNENYIRVIRPGELDGISSEAFQKAKDLVKANPRRQEASNECVWHMLPTLRTFAKFRDYRKNGFSWTSSDLITPVIRDLQKL